MKSCLKTPRTILLALITGLILLGSCKKSALLEPDVYIAGTYTNANNVTNACYWKNGEFFPVLDQSKKTLVNNMAVSNGAVYMCGQYDGQPCYWKDGVLYPFSPNGQNYYYKPLIGLLIRGQNYYFSGIYTTIDNGLNPKAAVWKTVEGAAVPPIPFSLENPTNNFAYGIAAKGDKIDDELYICGSVGGTPGYWIVTLNGEGYIQSSTWTPLGTEPGTGLTIKYFQGNLYVFGKYTLADGTYYGYWKNNQPFVSMGVKAGEDSNITCMEILDSGKLIYGGSFTNLDQIEQAAYWVNNERTDLSSEVSQVSNISHWGNDIYIVGNIGTPVKACYWKNGKPVIFDQLNSTGTAIAIVAK